MRVVATNVHKNPVTFDVPWLFAEDEEVFLSLQYDQRTGRGERVIIDVPRSYPVVGGDPLHAIVVGTEKGAEEGQVEFYIDVHTEGEGPERVYSVLLDKEDE